MNENFINSENLRFLLTEQLERFSAQDLGQPRDVLGQFGPLLKSPQIIVISGLRRAGKSTLQAQIARKFFPNDYYYINFDDERWTGFKAAQFSQVHEQLMGLFGKKKFFLMDEIQNIPRWELFVRRLHDDGHKLVLTGSNASLLSREIGSHLTGRHRTIELFPFSFHEYLTFNDIKIPPKTTAESARVGKAFRDYMSIGGIPDALKYPDDTICSQLYQDIIYRDISARYNIDSLKSLKELSLFLVGNIGRPISFNKLRQPFGIRSVNTVKSYIDHLESSWLYFTINVYSHSIKQQQIAPKKVYCIDNGIVNQVAFRSSEDTGWFLENAVFLHLRRLFAEIFYDKNDDGTEVDFLIRKGTNPVELVQVTTSLRNEATRKREVSALLKSMDRHKLQSGTIVTLEEREAIREGSQKIRVVPASEFFCQ